MRAFPFLTVMAFFASTPLRAEDSWRQTFQGVRQLERQLETPRGPSRLTAVLVDTTVKGVHFNATPSAMRGLTPSHYGQQVGAQLVVNGDSFGPRFSPDGLAVGDGSRWSDTRDDRRSSRLVLGASRLKMVRPGERFAFDGSWMKGVISGRPQLLADGGLVELSSSPCTSAVARTATGLSADGKQLFLAVVTSSAESAGATCAEMARALKTLGAAEAFLLSGAELSAMYVEGEGVVTGSESPGANHLAVFAPVLPTLGTLRGVVFEMPHHDARLPGSKVRLQTGQTLEADASGSWQFHLPAGEYTVTAEHAGYVSASETRQVTAGVTLWASVGLQARTGGEGEPLPDRDGDGVSDADDNCPDVANPAQIDADADELGNECDEDDDGDERPDLIDNCPFLANPDQSDADGDLIGDACDGAPQPVPADSGERPVSAPLPEASPQSPDATIPSGCAAAPGSLGLFAIAFLLAPPLCRRRRLALEASRELPRRAPPQSV